jgi:UDP-glucuronate decarboxylase
LIDKIVHEDSEKIKDSLERGVFEGKRVLVTGGAGFLGSWICQVLVDFDAEVVCLDNLSTGKRSNVDYVLGKRNFRFVEGDVSSFHEDSKFDYILHLASRASPVEYQQHPIETLRANSEGSYNISEMARRHDAKVLFSSTSEVYGDADVVPTPETYWGNVNPVGVRSCYDEGKRFGEALFMAYNRQYVLDVRIARIFNTYGPRLRAEGAYGRVVSRFVTQVLSNQPLTVYGDGRQTRAFCYVTDTAKGLLLLLTKEEARGEIVNLGNPLEMSVLELAEMVRGLAGSGSPITFHPLPSDDPKRRCPDISKAQKLLGWKTEISPEKGLARTIEWFRVNEMREKTHD